MANVILGLLDVPVDDGPQAVDVHVLQQLLHVPHPARRRRTLLLLLHLQRGVGGGGGGRIIGLVMKKINFIISPKFRLPSNPTGK